MNEFFIKHVQLSGLTQYQIAKMAGVPFSTINGLMLQTHDINKCGAATLYSLATVLGTPIERLLNPYPQMENVHDVYNGLKYHWEKNDDDTMNIVFKDHGEKIVISTGYKFNLPEQRSSCPLFAELLIDRYFSDNQINKLLAKI